MNHVVLQIAKNEVQHVKEMHPDIRGNAAGLLGVAFPRLQVPMTSRGDVGQVYLVFPVVLATEHLLTQRDDRWMHAKLQDSADLVAAVPFDFLQAVDVPRVEYQWLFADGIGAGAQRETHM